MPAPITLIVLVGAGQVASPLSVAMAQATHDAYGGALTDVRETPAAPADADALLVEALSHPDVVALVRWDGPRDRHATLRMHLVRSQRWIERSFDFAPSDPTAERGRTLGFAAAAILPEAVEPANVSAGGPLPSASPPVAPPSTAPVPQGTRPPQSSLPPSQPAAARPASEALTAAPSSARPEGHEAQPDLAEISSWRARFALDVAAEGAIGVNWAGGGIGGGAALHWFLLPLFSLRLGAGARVGSLDVAKANLSTFEATAGVAVHPWRATGSRPFGLSVRADYLLTNQSATHYDPDDPRSVTVSRWLSGFDAFVEGTWFFTSEIGLLVGLGLEDVLAPTYISLRSVPVVTLPPLRAAAEAGLRLRF